MKRQIRPVLVFGLILLSTAAGHAQDVAKNKSGTDHPWALLLYGGTHADETLEDIFTFEADYAGDNNLLIVALAREVYRYKHYLSFELEGQIGRHFGDDVSHWEFVGLGLGRWHPFPWDDHVDTSFAFGAGLSYYTEVSRIEEEEDEDAQRLLGYLVYELTFGLPRIPRWDLLLRIHHRSGMGGIIGDGSSNYVCLGLKYAF